MGPVVERYFTYNIRIMVKKNHLQILVIEDDQDYREALCDMLALEGYFSEGVGSVEAFYALPNKEKYKLLLLDRNLPDGDGLEILEAHRKISSVPVIFITCEGRIEDRVASMNADADYYLVKPVNPSELLSIVQRCFRRRESTGEANVWKIDLVAWSLQDPSGKEVSLTRTETLLLRTFADKPGIAVCRDEIIVALGKHPDAYDHRRLEVAIRRLRKKAEEAQLIKLPLDTVYGIGYVLNAELKLKNS